MGEYERFKGIPRKPGGIEGGDRRKGKNKERPQPEQQRIVGISRNSRQRLWLIGAALGVSISGGVVLALETCFPQNPSDETPPTIPLPEGGTKDAASDLVPDNELDGGLDADSGDAQDGATDASIDGGLTDGGKNDSQDGGTRDAGVPKDGGIVFDAGEQTCVENPLGGAKACVGPKGLEGEVHVGPFKGIISVRDGGVEGQIKTPNGPIIFSP